MRKRKDLDFNNAEISTLFPNKITKVIDGSLTKMINYYTKLLTNNLEIPQPHLTVIN